MTNHKQCISLVVKFLNGKKIVWPLEVKMAKKLLELYPYSMLFSIDGLRVNSLTWFFTENGKAFLRKYMHDNKYRKDIISTIHHGIESV